MPKTDNRKPKTISFSTPAHAEADRLLRVLETERESFAESQRLFTDEFERLKKSSPVWQGLEGDCRYYEMRMGLAEKKLKKFLEEQKQDLFSPTGMAPESIKTEVSHGDLFYSLDYAVIKPRKVDVLANIEEYALLEIYGLGDYRGFAEAVKVAKSVNWDLLKTWPQERLIMVGTEKKPKETFTFDLREAL
ncbi:MAG: host-nuclease inhibitor Gam family protein [Deltaproteobacteria bacterium]|nr:host-nuclease inhibitor Gam family protein [Deltaproteobacteria bacterium]